VSNYPVEWKLGNELIQIAKSKVHLGIPIMSDMKNTEAVIKACDKGKKSLHGLFGICDFQRKCKPITHIKLYRKIVLPSALYGCELWTNWTTNNIRSLRKMQHYSLKRIQDLRKFTRSDMVESLVGLFDISFEIDRKK
jgi:hypothetical protein